MKKQSKNYLLVFPFLLGIYLLIFLSCHKEIQRPDGNKKPPVANAGYDQTISLPVNHVILDGTGSSDPDGRITGFQWRKISGPGSISISNDTSVQTQVTNLIEGTYSFELKVTDAGGLYDTDTVMITVQVEITCDNSNRPIVNAQLIPLGLLSVARSHISVATAGNKIVFGGGYQSNGESSVVDIYDISTKTWSTANLSAAREGSAAIAAGNKIFFAGGGHFYSEYYSNVDIYDVSNNSWSATSLTVSKTGIGAAVVGNKVMFAGGYDELDNYTKEVEIYDLATNSWSKESLSEARGFINGVTVGEKVYFAGGVYYAGFYYYSLSSKIDIYDNHTQTWATSSLSFINGGLAGVTDGQNIYWSGNGCNVEIFNSNSGTSSSSLLHRKDAFYSVIRNGKIIFLRGGSNFFDIYDPSSNQWSEGVLPSSVPGGAAIICVNNTIYIAGGTVGCTPIGDGGCTPVSTNQVYKLEF
jgi:hypothetical protein